MRTRAPQLALAGILALAAVMASCSQQRDVRLYLDEPFPKKLSAWGLLSVDGGKITPNSRVLPYDLNTPLFSDYAVKYRYVWMPPGASAEYRDDAVFDLPVGTILVKSFAFPAEDHPAKERLIETRLLVRTKAGWKPLPYVWDAAQREATLQIVADPVAIRYSDRNGTKHDFTYQIPNTNECRECHDNNKSLQPIGPKSRNLNKDFAYADGKANQLVRWTSMGYLKGTPDLATISKAAEWNVPASGSLDERARAYLDNNCAHCHQPGGTAGYTGIDFRLNHFDSLRFGVCKHPNSAGNMGDRRFDLVPGQPDESILLYRLESTAPKIMMPQIGRAVVHAEGVALLREWITQLSGESCGLTSRAGPRTGD